MVRKRVAVDRVEHPSITPSGAPHNLELGPSLLDQPRDVRVAKVVESERLQSRARDRGIPLPGVVDVETFVVGRALQQPSLGK